MTSHDSTYTLAVFLDLENIALGAQDARFPQFDIAKVFERLLIKGNIVVKKAYCDFARYEAFKRPLHEAAFELIEIPHVRQSGKNSADIRMVVDALDLCYTNEHVDAFAIISGDSDFSPLVSKLRENGKTVIGVGVKNSTSDLFIANCDEFIYYDDLVRVAPAKTTPRSTKAASAAPKAAANTNSEPKRPDPAKALDLVLATVNALIDERGADESIWASMVKQAIKRQNPGFNERAYGFSAFTDLLREGQKRGLLKLEEKAGNCMVRLAD
ncbi:NYN domain-containing protein [Rariglobus hedericola]|uniref:NYN domain-containing protein n=1 Tax=Rariglobus hedericola TaxID=2597822 RepID=A0A556QQI6_9BACT|nr:NYN domain-containing protein [Rariglobus hedericola]TSJ78889.1 NYN domain-containing protein [Rariglobus hedericola]